MPLNEAEQIELQQLQEEEAQAIQAQGQEAQSGLTPEEDFELQSLLQEEQQAQTQLSQAQPEPAQEDPLAQFSGNPEAELGPLNRLQFSIEPLESNRRAFLIKKFGVENVLRDESGNLFLQQSGQIRPLNQAGFSQADMAEFLGAIPEIVGAGIGMAAGTPGGIPTMLAGGAAGGVAGAAARQVVSGLLTEVPQVDLLDPSSGERAGNLLLSAGLGAFGGAIGAASKQLVQGVGKFIGPKITKRAAELTTQADEFGIKPTIGQKFGGIIERQEKILEKIPFFGRKVRKEISEQSKKIYETLKQEIGDFTGIDRVGPEVGAGLKKVVTSKIESIKMGARELFEDFAERGKDTILKTNQVKNSFLNRIEKFGVYDTKGQPVPFSPKTAGLEQSEYNAIRKVLDPIMEDLKETQVNAVGLNNIRKSLDKAITVFQTEGRVAGVSDVAMLKIRSSFMDSVENALEKRGDELLLQFKTARQMWAEAMKNTKLADDLGVNLVNTKKVLADEKVLRRVILDSKNYEKVVELVGKEDAAQLAIKALEDTARVTAGAGDQFSAAKILTFLNKNNEVYKRAFGKEKVNKLAGLLDFAKQNHVPVNPSMTEVTRLQEMNLRTLGTGITLGTFRALLEGALKMPAKIGTGARALIQTRGQEPKRRLSFPSEEEEEKPKKGLNINKRK